MSFVITDVTKNFGSVKALKGVSMELKRGEVLGLLGPNGAGKSTLMKILTGYYTKWEGDIHFFDQDLRTELRDIQKKTGYLPENNPLYSEMYVVEYLKFCAGLYNISKPQLGEIIQKTGLENHAQNKIYTLSKGYKQRLGLAAALIHNPDVVILDEPTSGLDPLKQQVFDELILEFKEKGTAEALPRYNRQRAVTISAALAEDYTLSLIHI